MIVKNSMTIRELLFLLDGSPWLILIYFIGLPVVSLIIGWMNGQISGASSPWKYFYSILVYLACVPGILSTVLTGYMIFFTRENLLDASLLLHLVPVISMVVTLMLIRKKVSFDDIPGFERLSGLITIISVTFIIVLFIYKSRVWVIFGGSVFVLAAVAVGLFALLKWGTYKLFRSRAESKLKAPSFDLKR